MGDCATESISSDVGDGKSDLADCPPLPLRKEPSFSRWCGDGPEIVLSRCSDGDGGSGSDDFELPQLVSSSRRGYSAINIEGAESSKLGGSLESSLSPWFVAKVLGLIVAWYALSMGLTLYNKELLGMRYMKFPAPFLMNTVHFAMQAVLSRAIVYFQQRRMGSDRVDISWKDYTMRVVPTALGTALDINLSNISLVFITITFATMCKSAAPIFILLFSFLFRLEKPSYQLVGIILVISTGILLTVAKETAFNLWGFIFIMLAAVMSGFRWSMTQILLQKEEHGLKNPFFLMSSVTPVMAISTAVLSLFIDPWHEFGKSVFFNSNLQILKSCLLLLFGGFLAFFMVLTEYFLVSATSALTVTIAGIVKEAVTILVAVIFFHDQFTWLKGFGLFIILLGVSLFNLYKYHNLRKAHSVEQSSNINGAAEYAILDETEDVDADG